MDHSDADIKIDQDRLRASRIFLATPMFGGMAFSIYVRSLFGLAQLLQKLGVGIDYYNLCNASLVTVARNMAANRFLESDATHLLMIDADIGFVPEDVLTLLALQTQDSPYDVIGGTYLKKQINWSRVRKAVLAGEADDKLIDFMGDYTFMPFTDKERGNVSFDRDNLVEVESIGAGFIMVRRSALEMMAPIVPDYTDYRGRGIETTAETMHQFFQAEIVNDRYVGEDFWFCKKLRAASGYVWLAPWVNLSHAGSFVFGGPFGHIMR